MSINKDLHIISAICVLCVLCSDASAQLPQPRLDRIIPLGGTAGSDVTLEVTGKDLDEAKALHFDHPGLAAEPVAENRFRVTIAAETPAGTYAVHVVGKHGISNARLFAVARDLTEVSEGEPNDEPESAHAVPMNVAIRGLSDAGGDDLFRFPARKGQRVVIDCLAHRLDSLMRPSVVVLSADGKELARGRPTVDRTDPMLDFVAPADGEYIAMVHDATYAGDQPYRLIISDRPHIETAFPPAVRAGESVELTVLGRNLPSGRPAPDWPTDGPPLEAVTVPLAAPADGEAGGFALIEAPYAASLNVRGRQLRPGGLEDALNPVTLALASAPVVPQREPNDAEDTARPIAMPAVVVGRFDRPGDADWFEVAARANEPIAVEVLCDRLAAPGDPRVVVLDIEGNEVATLDDHGVDKNNSITTTLMQSNRDPLGRFTPPEDGVYRLLVQETYGRGGARFVYALRVGPPEPDIAPVAFADVAADPFCPTVRRGGSTYYLVCLNRRDGFGGPVTIRAEGLPTGVSCPPIHVGPQTEFAAVVFTATADAPDWAGAVRLVARAILGDKPVERPVGFADRRWPSGEPTPSRAGREVCLAVRPDAPYGLRLPSGPVTVPAGGSVEVRLEVARHRPGLRSPIQIAGLELPPGFEVAPTEVAGDAAGATIAVTVSADVPPGLYSIVLRGEARVPSSAEPEAADATEVRVADPTTPLAIIVSAPPTP